MKKKILLSSVLTIVLCLSLIAGSTFALFTSESTVNVAVTAGKVNVTARAENVTLSSTLGANVPETTATFSATTNVVTIDKMVPGDVIEFDIVVTNNSNVTVDFKPVIGVEKDTGLWSGLTVEFAKADGTTIPYTLTNGAWTGDYVELAPGVNPETIHVTITLPEAAGNEYQQTSCSFSYKVEVVQGNAQ